MSPPQCCILPLPSRVAFRPARLSVSMAVGGCPSENRHYPMDRGGDRALRVPRAGCLRSISGIGRAAEQPTLRVAVDWTKVVATSNLSPSVYVVTNPMMRPGSPIHGPVNQALKELNADYLRYMAYPLHPRLSIAALYPPKEGKTSWDFSTMDPLILDFFEAAEGRPAILELSTFPAWFFKTGRDFIYADDRRRKVPNNGNTPSSRRRVTKLS